MKSCIYQSLLFGALSAILSALPLDAQEAENRTVPILDQPSVSSLRVSEQLQNALTFPAGTWWSKHYVPGLGLSVFDENVVGVPKPVFKGKESIIGFDGTEAVNWKNLHKTLEDARQKGLKTNYALSDLVPAGLEKSDLGNVPFFPLVLLRIQDDLTSKPFDAQPGTVLWTSDRDNGSSTMINAALIADLYFGGIGSFGRYSSEGMFHLLLGGELERFDGGDANSEIDIRRYLAVAEFSPGGILGMTDKGTGWLRQTMTVGWLHEDDVVNDVQRNSFQLKLAPSFKLPGFNMLVGERSYYKKLLQFLSIDDVNSIIGDDPASLGQPANKAQIQGDKAEQAAAANASAADELSRSRLAALAAAAGRPAWTGQKFDNFFYFRPKVGVDYGQASVSSILKDREIPDLNLTYSLEAGFSFIKESYNVGYRLTGFTGVTEGDTIVCNEFFLQATPHGWPGRIFATYKRGKVAPSFVDVDVVQVGFGVKF